MRHRDLVTRFDPGRGVLIGTLACDYPPAYRIPEHAHGSDQLIYAIRGVMQVTSGTSTWLIPPDFALWLPARTLHSIVMMSGAVSMRTLYCRRGCLRGKQPPEPACTVLHVTPLLRELILAAVRLGKLRTAHRVERALVDLLSSCLAEASALPIVVTLPREPRALALARTVIANPGALQTLAGLCSQVGLSVRTMQRIFQRDVGMHFEIWRRQVRLMKAVELLVAGASVKEVAFRVGYRQSSAFVDAFRSTFGATPKAWVQTRQNSPAMEPRIRSTRLKEN